MEFPFLKIITDQNNNILYEVYISVPSQQMPGALRMEKVDNVSHFGETKSLEVHELISDQFQGDNFVADVFRIDNCEC